MEDIMEILYEESRRIELFPPGISSATGTSAVLFLLGQHCGSPDLSMEPCAIFNKRSVKVKQAGDLCFPGGSIAPKLDSSLSKLLYLPFSPLRRWPYWKRLNRLKRDEGRRLALLFTSSLRESFEEMWLNPFRVTFLGPLPSESLEMFDRVIYPMVGWIPSQKDFVPNWEVERIVYIPLRDLLKPDHYSRYRLHMGSRSQNGRDLGIQDFPCFLHGRGDHAEVLWGATYRIVMTSFNWSLDSPHQTPGLSLSCVGLLTKAMSKEPLDLSAKP
jgi:hypothetical protein